MLEFVGLLRGDGSCLLFCYRRARRRKNTQDIELAMDMMVVFSDEDDCNAYSAIVERLAKKLELHSVKDLEVETVVVGYLARERKGHQEERHGK
ncbi:hypothetical protein RYX36_035104 [Vicia faba]